MNATFEERIDEVADEAVNGAALVAGLVGLIEREIPCLGAMHYQRGPHGLTPLAGTLCSLPYAHYRDVLGPDRDPLQWAGTHLKPRPRIVEASGLVPRHEFVASPAYADFYRRHEIEHVTCLWLTDRPYSSPDFAGLMIARARAHGALRVDDRRRLEQVLPLLVAASMPRPPEGERRPELIFGPTEDLFGVPDEMATALSKAGIDPARLVREVAARLRASDVATARRMFLPHPQHRQVLEVLVRWDPSTRRGALSLAPTGSAAERELRARSLTSAEICVLQAVSDGLGTDAIASDLFMSRETVRTHVKRILQKLDVPTRTQAALIMQRLLMAASPAS